MPNFALKEQTEVIGSFLLLIMFWIGFSGLTTIFFFIKEVKLGLWKKDPVDAVIFIRVFQSVIIIYFF